MLERPGSFILQQVVEGRSRWTWLKLEKAFRFGEIATSGYFESHAVYVGEGKFIQAGQCDFAACLHALDQRGHERAMRVFCGEGAGAHGAKYTGGFNRAPRKTQGEPGDTVQGSCAIYAAAAQLDAAVAARYASPADCTADHKTASAGVTGKGPHPTENPLCRVGMGGALSSIYWYLEETP